MAFRLTTSHVAFGLLTSVLFFFPVGSAMSAVLNVDINPTVGSLTPTTYTGTAPGGGGIWNSYAYTVPNNSTTFDPPAQGAFVDSVGNPTNVSFDLGSVFGDNQSTGGSASGNALIDDYAYFGSGGSSGVQTTPFSISGLLPNSPYDIYLYAMPANFTTNDTTFTITGGPTGTVDTDNTFTSTGFDEDTGAADSGNYVLLSATSNALGSIDGIISEVDNFAIFNGFQIVGTFVAEPAPVPEPSSILLLGLGALGLARHTRRRRVRA